MQQSPTICPFLPLPNPTPSLLLILLFLIRDIDSCHGALTWLLSFFSCDNLAYFGLAAFDWIPELSSSVMIHTVSTLRQSLSFISCALRFIISPFLLLPPTPLLKGLVLLTYIHI